MLIVKERIREMYVIACIQPIIFWSGVLISYKYWGLLSFAIFKFLAVFVSEMYYLKVFSNYLEISVYKLFKEIMASIIVPVIFIVILGTLTKDMLPFYKHFLMPYNNEVFFAQKLFHQ